MGRNQKIVTIWDYSLQVDQSSSCRLREIAEEGNQKVEEFDKVSALEP